MTILALPGLNELFPILLILALLAGGGLLLRYWIVRLAVRHERERS